MRVFPEPIHAPVFRRVSTLGEGRERGYREAGAEAASNRHIAPNCGVIWLVIHASHSLARCARR